MLSKELTLRKRILNTFEYKKINRIVFSPRLYYWYLGNKLHLKLTANKRYFANIPSHYLGKTQYEIYTLLGASPRYVFETFYFPLYREKIESKAEIIIREQKGAKPSEIVTSYKTPIGSLRKITKNGHIIEYPVKSLNDIKIMKYILNNTRFQFLDRNYKKAEVLLGNNGIPCTFFPRSPYMSLIVDYMGFSKTIIFLKKFPSQLETFMKFIDEWDNDMYENLANSPLKIINFGENIDANLSPPPYFEKFLIPYYKKRVKQFHDARKICHIHIDGSIKDLLPYLADLPFDGLEALTAKPQGDVTLNEIKDSIGDKILLDGVPSILFLPQYSIKYVKDYTQKVLDLFSPNLILGVSDELPPNGDISKIKMMVDVINSFEVS